MLNGLFDIQFRLQKIDSNGDPLTVLNDLISWELFRPQLATLRDKPRKSNGGAKGYDCVLMFKVLILQSLYNLSDDGTEAQILDRLSFMRFLGLGLGNKVPDAKTIWAFREQVTEAGLTRELFDRFDAYLQEHGYAARKGQIVDASIVSTPKQRNRREENKKIKAGQPIEDWPESKRRQKDVDARWTRKNNQNFFGYKNHVNVDVKHKLIRDYAVTDASVHERHLLERLLSEDNTSRHIWGDSAYSGGELLQMLKNLGYREHMNRKGTGTYPLPEKQKILNRKKSKIRARVEHIFGAQAQRAGNLLLRTIGMVRARCKIGLRNLAYNLDRYAKLRTAT